MPRIELVERFVKQSPALYASYLEFVDRQNNFELESPGSFLSFVLWFVVHGRREFRAPCVMDDALRTAVTTLDTASCHPLMHYMAGQSGLALQGDALRAWFYGEGVPSYATAGFLGRPELESLAKPIAPGDPSTELDRLLVLSQRASEGVLDRAFTDRLARIARGAKARQNLPSVTIVGLHRSVLGLGEDARCLFDCLCDAGIVAELLDVSPPGLEPFDRAAQYAPFETASVTGSVVIYCLPASEMMHSIGTLNLPTMTADQYRIGYWPWETTALPPSWGLVYDQVDEVWASSSFLRQVYTGQTNKPVVVMPLHIRVEAPVTPEDLTSVFAGRFSFLSVFDFNSRIERKNPLGSIAAFRKAFPEAIRDVQLVLKTLHGDNRPADLARIVEAAGGDERIVFIDGALPKAELCGLMTLADVYLSPHRSEGFGRPLAEAMLLGIPVIATGWSGPADFLNPDTGFPIRSILRPVRREEYALAAGEWAEPDIDHAAALMRRVYDQPSTAERVVATAKETAERLFGQRAVSARLLERLSGLAQAARP